MYHSRTFREKPRRINSEDGHKKFCSCGIC
ncbi:hypothetical protein R3I94_004947 [Phoxinus phoxinus]